MTPISQFDAQQMQQRTDRARNPEHYAKIEEAKREKWQSGKERELQQAIQDYAETHAGCYVLRPRMDKRSQLPLGYPDLTVMRNGRAVLIEVKAKGGVLSDDQKECHAELALTGNRVLVAYDLQTAIDYIRRELQ